MKAAVPHPNTAMAIFPSVVGFGWTVFDGPFSPVVWEVSTAAAKVRGDERKNAVSLARIAAHRARYRPAVLVLEDFESKEAKRGARIQALCRSIIAHAAVEGIPVRIITRAEINACIPGGKTRQNVANTTAAYLRELRLRLPEARKIWEGEKPDMALMNAAALLIVHYAIPEKEGAKA